MGSTLMLQPYFSLIIRVTRSAVSFAASASAPYTTIAEMGKWMSENPNEVVRLAVEAGGGKAASMAETNSGEAPVP